MEEKVAPPRVAGSLRETWDGQEKSKPEEHI